MRKLSLVTILCASLLFPCSALAWNGKGHQTVAYVAYKSISDGSSPATQKRVDGLLMRHPDYNTWVVGVPAAQRGLRAFLMAAIWPDSLRSNAKYVDDKCPSPDSDKGFADLRKHRYWHFVDIGFSTDGTAVQEPCAPNALVKIAEFQDALGNSAVEDDLQAYDLTWLIHLVGDIHQPLHATARFSAAQTDGDFGGNGYTIKAYRPEGACPKCLVTNLHSFWDDVLGVQTDFKSVSLLGNSLMKELKPDASAQTVNPATVQDWINESAAVGEFFIYTIDDDKKGSAAPAISPAYEKYAKAIARHRAAQGGYRLAEMLKAKLK